WSSDVCSSDLHRWYRAPFTCCAAAGQVPACSGSLVTESRTNRGQLQVFLVYRLQRPQRFVNMSLRGVLREEDVTDNALSVDDIGHAPRQSESCGYPIALSDDA